MDAVLAAVPLFLVLSAALLLINRRERQVAYSQEERHRARGFYLVAAFFIGMVVVVVEGATAHLSIGSADRVGGLYILGFIICSLVLQARWRRDGGIF